MRNEKRLWVIRICDEISKTTTKEINELLEKESAIDLNKLEQNLVQNGDQNLRLFTEKESVQSVAPNYATNKGTVSRRKSSFVLPKILKIVGNDVDAAMLGAFNGNQVVSSLNDTYNVL
ncbi:hypothetical protein U1Q18_017470 [Sarracenia purpurea var. burkii]